MVVMEASGISQTNAIRSVLKESSDPLVALEHVVVAVDAVNFFKIQGAIRMGLEQVKTAGVILLN